MNINKLELLDLFNDKSNKNLPGQASTEIYNTTNSSTIFDFISIKNFEDAVDFLRSRYYAYKVNPQMMSALKTDLVAVIKYLISINVVKIDIKPDDIQLFQCKHDGVTIHICKKGKTIIEHEDCQKGGIY